MTLRWVVMAVGLAMWVVLALAFVAGVQAAWLPWALAALTLLLASEAVTRLSQRVQAWRKRRNDDA